MMTFSIFVSFFIVGCIASDSKSSTTTEFFSRFSKDNTDPSTSDLTDAQSMPTIFNLPSEQMYDRYAACLAATEGLRRVRDAETGVQPSSANDFWKGTKSFLFPQKKGASSITDEMKTRAEAKYIVNSSKVIRALGLTVPQFNQLGREIMNDSWLKERVSFQGIGLYRKVFCFLYTFMLTNPSSSLPTRHFSTKSTNAHQVAEQAYLYRINASLSLPRTPIQPKEEQLLKAHRRRVDMFAQSVKEIEQLRQEQMDRLCKALQVDHIPPGINICDPQVMPLLNPKVRAVCEAFPLQAQEIVKKYGLNSEEFNRMLEETKKNPIFRRKVEKVVGKVEGEQGPFE